MSEQVISGAYLFGPFFAIGFVACLQDWLRSLKDEPSKIIASKRARRSV